MNRIISTLLLLIAALASPYYCVAGSDTPKKPHEIVIDPLPDNGGTMDRPKMPAYSPVRACVYDNEIVIYSISEGIGEISVTNAYGITIASETAELSEGISIELPDGTDGITVTVVFNNRTYSASL